AEVSYSLPVPPLPRKAFRVGDGPSAGPKDAKVTVVTFSDFQCPYCARATRTVEELKQFYGDKIRIAYRHFPLSQHTRATPAAEASHCADEQGKFWEYHDVLYQNQQSLEEADLTRYAEDLKL